MTRSQFLPMMAFTFLVDAHNDFIDPTADIRWNDELIKAGRVRLRTTPLADPWYDQFGSDQPRLIRQMAQLCLQRRPHR